MAVRTLTDDEKHEISVANIRTFTGLCPDFYLSDANLERMQEFIVAQVGTRYPISQENLWMAWDHLKNELEVRPPCEAEIILREEKRQKAAQAAAEEAQRNAPPVVPPTPEEMEDEAFIKKMEHANHVPGGSTMLTKENMHRFQEIEKKRRYGKMRARGLDPAKVLERAGDFTGTTRLHQQSLNALPKQKI